MHTLFLKQWFWKKKLEYPFPLTDPRLFRVGAISCSAFWGHCFAEYTVGWLWCQSSFYHFLHIFLNMALYNEIISAVGGLQLDTREEGEAKKKKKKQGRFLFLFFFFQHKLTPQIYKLWLKHDVEAICVGRSRNTMSCDFLYELTGIIKCLVY